MNRWLKQKVFWSITKLFGDNNGLMLLSVVGGPAKGLCFKLDLVNRLEVGYFYGTYELDITRRIAQIIKKDWTVWDCGAYIGFYTALFARLVGPEGKVVAFEPDPRNMARTKENMRLNDLDNIQFIAAAIGKPKGEISFILSNSTNSHIPGTYVGANIEEYRRIERIDDLIRVDCLSLEHAYTRGDIPKPDLIKMDIDGSEIDALKAADRLIYEAAPLIVLELHNPECDSAAWEFAQKFNYSLWSLNSRKVINKPEETGGTVLCLPSNKLERF